MKVTKVSAAVLDTPPQSRDLTPRQLGRLELERSLEKAINDAHADKSAAFRIRLDRGEKMATIRGAFGRAKTRTGHGDVNLFKVGDDLDLALELFHAEDAPVPLTALARELVGLALVDDSDHDIRAVVRLYRRPRVDPADR